MATYNLEALTKPSPYDNSLSFLHKRAVALEVPVRFVLIRPSRELSSKFIDTFDLEENKDAEFLTIFDFINQLVTEDPNVTLTQIWDIISSFHGDMFNPLELPFIWLHAIPQYRVDNEAVLEQVNTFMKNLGEPINYSNMMEVLYEYHGSSETSSTSSDWVSRYELEKSKDLETLKEYVENHRLIGSIKPLDHSPIQIESSMISYDYPLESGINPLADLFNSSTTSYTVPFIQYNIKQIKGQSDEVERYYKIYKGKSIDTRPDYNNVVLTSVQASRGESLYLNIWTGVDEEDAQKGKKEGFTTVTIFYLDSENILRIVFTSPRTDEVDENVMIDRLHRHLPTLYKPKIWNDLRISGSFIIYNMTLIQVALFHLIMNDPLFSNYLYLEEAGKSFAEKTRLNIHYRGANTDLSEGRGSYRIDKNGRKKLKRKSAVSAAISEGSTEIGKVYYIIRNGVSQALTAERVYPIIEVKITRATSLKIANQFVDILSRLFRRYAEKGKSIVDLYLKFVPEYLQVIQPSPEEGETITKITEPIAGESRISQLRRLAPEIFLAGYARKCQVERQPQPIYKPEEITYWKNKYTNFQGVSRPREILTFPHPNPVITLVCPDDTYPFPGVIKNTTENKDIYPLVPCCHMKPQLTEPTSKLRRYLSGNELEAKAITGRTAHVIKGNKILKPDQRALVDTSVVSLLSKYEDLETNFYRYGVALSLNSFIHCVAYALQHPDYINAQDRESWTQEYRENLFNHQYIRTIGGLTVEESLRPESLRQELFDMSIEDIIKSATDNNTVFDPLLYYRALEILFDCNIYIFDIVDQDYRNGRKISLLKLPRYQHFHVHPPSPGKNVILIVRHLGSESSTLGYPQCELIVDWRLNEQRFVFDDSMNEIIYPAMDFVARTISWQIYQTTNNPILTARLNQYSSINYQLLFGDIYVAGQIIDSSGKARMFALTPEFSNTQKTQFSNLWIFVGVNPTSPLNIPEFKPADVSDKLPPYNKVVELFGKPISAITTIDKKTITGLWFPIGDIQFGFYCPIQDVSWDSLIKVYPDLELDSEMISLTIQIPRVKKTPSPIKRIRQLNRASDFIDQIVKYLYLVDGRPQDIVEFINRIGRVIYPPKPDSLVIYNVSKIPRILPTGTVEEILQQLTEISNIFYQGHLLIYDEQMFNGLVYKLKKFARDIDGLEIPLGQYRQLRNYYESITDFNFNPDKEFILGSLRDFDRWLGIYVHSPNLQQRTIQNLKSNIQTRLNPIAFTYEEPYIFQKSDNNSVGSSYNPTADKFYLIQNVAGGEILKAINVSQNWFTHKSNLGFRAPPIDLEQSPLVSITPIQPLGTGYKVVIEPELPSIGLGPSSSGMSTVPMRPGPIVQTIPPQSKTQTTLPSHVIYKISPGGGIIISQNNTGLSDSDLDSSTGNYLEILNYGNNIYAALLPIL
jgi:hypothetical protein